MVTTQLHTHTVTRLVLRAPVTFARLRIGWLDGYALRLHVWTHLRITVVRAVCGWFALPRFTLRCRYARLVLLVGHGYICGYARTVDLRLLHGAPLVTHVYGLRALNTHGLDWLRLRLRADVAHTHTRTPRYTRFTPHPGWLILHVDSTRYATPRLRWTFTFADYAFTFGYGLIWICVRALDYVWVTFAHAHHPTV